MIFPRKKILFYFILVFLLSENVCSAQGFFKNFLPDTSKHRKIFLNWIPFAGYSPETNFAFGAVGIATSNFGTDTVKQRPSSAQLALVYTLNKQLYFYIPYQLFFDEQKYSVYGEVGYYEYNYEFFGIGNNPTQPANYSEEYFVNYPRVRVTALRKLTTILYAGVKYSYDYFQITKEQPGGELITDSIPGSKGGGVSGLGAAFIIDSRDNIFFPSRGVYVETFLQPFTTWEGSDFKYTLFSVTASKYIATFKNQVLAFNLYYESAAGTAPFYELPYIGGETVLRGLYEGTFRNNYATALQGEYRFHIWRFIGGDVFGDMGEVFHTPHEASTTLLHYTYGGGLRFQVDPVQKINLRGDMGIYKGQPAFYFTYGEAF
jgi:outer membrane protein assembly factor BamA